MSSGFQHIIFAMFYISAIFSGHVLIDVDHVRSHSPKELWNAFKGVSFIHNPRDDTLHFMHQPKVYNAVFLGIGWFVLFGVFYYLHLKKDGVL